MEEKWEPVKDYEGLYEVSSMGRVRSLDRKVRKWDGFRTVRGRVIRPQISNVGYFRVCMSKEGKYHYHSVHRLVALTFLPNPEGKPVVNHLDGNKTNNKVNNLEWCTRSENDRHAFQTGLRTMSKNLRVALIKSHAKAVRCIDDGKEFDQIKKAAEYYGIKHSGIGRVLAGGRKRTGGRRFEYIDKKS